jgi:tetratricopeptide (TPR) repeat protein
LNATSQNPIASLERLIRHGHFKRARVLVETRFREHPEQPDSLWLMATIKQIWGDLESAREFAESAIRLDNRNPQYHLRMAEVLIDMASKSNGAVFQRMSLAGRFREEIETTLSLDPQNVRAMSDLVLYYLNAPAFAGGSRSKACALAEQIGGIDPVEGILAQARIKKADKEAGGLERLYRMAVETCPKSYEARVALGAHLVSADANQSAEAEVHAREAIRLDPNRTGAYPIVAIALVRQKMWPELDALMTTADHAVPDYAAHYFHAAVALVNTAVELERAETYLRRYIAADAGPWEPSLSAARWRLGQALEKMGRRGEAFAEFRSAVQGDPESPAKADLARLAS